MEGPLRRKPERSLGTLYNDHNFVQGYAQSLLHFTQAAAAGRPVTVGTLEDALEVMKVHELMCARPMVSMEGWGFTRSTPGGRSISHTSGSTIAGLGAAGELPTG